MAHPLLKVPNNVSMLTRVKHKLMILETQYNIKLAHNDSFFISSFSGFHSWHLKKCDALSTQYKLTFCIEKKNTP